MCVCACDDDVDVSVTGTTFLNRATFDCFTMLHERARSPSLFRDFISLLPLPPLREAARDSEGVGWRGITRLSIRFHYSH